MNLLYHFDNTRLWKIAHIINQLSRFIALTHIIEFNTLGLSIDAVGLSNNCDIGTR